MKLPYRGAVKMTTPFGKKGSWQCGWHIGLDLVGTDKRIFPIADGRVIKVGTTGSYGNHVMIQSPDGLVVVYAHLSQVNVRKGQSVTTYMQLGVEGSTGNSSGSHLHLEIHKGEYDYPPAGSSPAKCPWLVNPAIALKIANKVGNVISTVSEDSEMEKKIKINLNNVVKEVTVVEKNGNNYVKLQDLRDNLIDISYDSINKMPKITAEQKTS